MKMGKKAFWVALATIISAPSFAAMVMPPKVGSEADVEAYIKRLVAEHPWVLSNGQVTREQLPTYIGTERHTLDQLLQLPEFVEAAEQRAELRTYRVRSYTSGVEQRYSLAKAHAGLAAVAPTDEILSEWTRELVTLLETIERRPLNSVLVGILKSLPKELGQAGFKIADVQEKIAYVRQAVAKLSDEQIRAEFQGARYGIAGDQWGTREVLALVDSALAASRTLFETSLRVLAATRAKNADVRGLAFDNRDQLAGAIEDAVDGSLERKTNWRLITQEFMLWMDNYFLLQQTEVPVVQHEVILEEMPPWVANYRGVLAGDCSTSHTAYYSYSPFERNFLIRKGGKVIAHASGTMVEVDGKKTFYFHDLSGAGAGGDANSLNLVLLAILDQPAAIGAEAVVLLTAAKRTNEIAWGTNHVAEVSDFGVQKALSYYAADHKIRAVLDIGAAANYDKVGYNTVGHPPKANYPRANIGKTEMAVINAEGKVSAAGKIDPTKVRVERLAILAGGFALPDGIPDAEAEALKSVAAVLANPNSQDSGVWYAQVTEALGKIGIKFSNKLLSDNLHLFQAGHFACPDVYGAVDEAVDKRSFLLLYDMLFKKTHGAAEVMKRLGPDWLRHPRLVKVLGQFLQERGAEGLARIQTMLEHDVPVVEILLDSADSRHALFASENGLLVFRTLQVLRARGDLNLGDREWSSVAELLDNEDEETPEEWSYLAAEVFALANPTPNLADVRKQLRASVREEEDERMLVLTSIAYLRYGIVDAANATESEMKAHDRAARHVRAAVRPAEISEPVWEEALGRIDDSIVAKVQAARDEKADKKRLKEEAECAAKLLADAQRAPAPRRQP